MNVPQTPATGWLTDGQLEAAIIAALAQRAANASTCPSEIARSLAPKHGQQWRVLMPRVRDAVARLARQERIIATRGPHVLSPDHLLGGPIRIRRGPGFDGCGN